MALKENYVDDILDTSKNTKRKYNMITNADGTVSFEDVTEYSQNGDSFGAADINEITKKVNKSLTSANVVDNLESTATDLPLSANKGNELNTKISTKLSFAEIVSVKKITANSTTTYTLNKVPTVMYFYINKGNNALYTLPVLMNTYGRAVAADIQINFTYNKNTKSLTVTCNTACEFTIYGLC